MENPIPYRKLWRSRRNRKIAGVCAGLGDYFRIDPLWVRILFVIFFFMGGSALLVYIILWLLIPIEPEIGTFNGNRHL